MWNTWWASLSLPQGGNKFSFEHIYFKEKTSSRQLERWVWCAGQSWELELEAGALILSLTSGGFICQSFWGLEACLHPCETFETGRETYINSYDLQEVKLHAIWLGAKGPWKERWQSSESHDGEYESRKQRARIADLSMGIGEPLPVRSTWKQHNMVDFRREGMRQKR